MDIQTKVTNRLLRLMCSPNLRKLRASSRMLKLAACFADYESDVLPPDSRLVEYPFVFSRILTAPRGCVLDIGCSARHNYLVPTLCTLGWEVYGIDIRDWAYRHCNFTFIKDDIRYRRFEYEIFNYVVCISTLEHIGLAGYYGITKEDNDGDIEAGKKICDILHRGGRLLLTVPYCNIYSVGAGARIFNAERLQKVFPDLTIIDKQFYALNESRSWALTNDLSREVVGCFEMVKR